MGLDMYLMKTVRTSVEKYNEVSNIVYDEKYSEFKELAEMRNKISKLKNNEIITTYEGIPIYASVSEYYTSFSLSMEVAYWRKANAIHAWFVKNVQNGEDDCGNYIVSKGLLIELRNLCIKVLDERNPELLKPKSGFFFGNTEIDEWYYGKLQYTVDTINDILSSTNFEKEVIMYSSSW
jgi:hypothetical protein